MIKDDQVFDSEAQRRQAQFLQLFDVPFNQELSNLCLKAANKQCGDYILPDGEAITLEQAFNKLVKNNLPNKSQDVDYKLFFENISIGNMVIEKQIKKIEERNTSLLHKWYRYNSIRNGLPFDEAKYPNDSVKSSNNDDYDDQSMSVGDMPAKIYPKTAKNDDKMLQPIAPGDKKKRHRRPASQIERHYKCPGKG